MALPDIFTKNVADEVIGRINKLTPATQPLWGKTAYPKCWPIAA